MTTPHQQSRTRRWKSRLANFADVELYVVELASGSKHEIALVHEAHDARIIALVPNMLDYIHARAASGDRHARALQGRCAP